MSLADASAPEPPFLEVTFNGGRFASHALPVEAAEELATVQDLIEQVARNLYFRENMGKKRVPKGFLDSSRLYLESSEKNCFTARLRRFSGSKPGLFESSLFDAAAKVVVGALLAASLNQPIPIDFPSNAISSLVTLGRRLDDNESLVLGKDSAFRATVTQETRKNLAAQYKRPLERIATIEGEIVEFDDANSTFQLLTRENERIEVPFARSESEKLLEAIRNKPIERVQIRGKMTCTATNKRMSAVDEMLIIEHERAVDIQKLWDRIGSFEQILDGWLDGAGIAPTVASIAQAKEVLSRVLADCPTVSRPTAYPTPSGGIQAEWVFGSWAVDLKFNHLGTQMILDATNADTGEDKNAMFSADEVNRNGATPLSEFLRSVVAEA